MKITFLLGTLLFFNATFAQNIVESKSNGLLEFVELDYGLASVKGGTVVNVNNTPTGTHGWLEDFVIIKVTDSVEAVLKANGFSNQEMVQSLTEDSGMPAANVS